MSIRGLPSFHFDPNALDSTRSAKERPRTLTSNCSVYSSTGVACVRVEVPDPVLSNPAPGFCLAFSVNVACGVLKLVEPSKVR